MRARARQPDGDNVGTDNSEAANVEYANVDGDDLGDDLKVGRRFVIPAHELQWRFSASGGPGGQHANTSNTKVELLYDIAGSSAIGPRQRARLVERFSTTARVVVSDERSQTRNREIARRRLAERLDEALRVQQARRPTVPTKASRERRLRQKHIQSLRKQERRPLSDP